MTAVEWLMLEKALVGYIDDEMVEQALELEKQQIMDAHLTGLIHPLEMEASVQAEQYYNETYKNP